VRLVSGAYYHPRERQERPKWYSCAVKLLEGIPMNRVRLAVIAAGAMLALAAVPTPASADHAWGSYHWARTANPLTLQLGNSTSGAWATSPTGPSYLALTSTEWSASSVLDTTVVAGTGKRRCGAVAGRVEVCNASYGFNGWLGVATISLSGSHITAATVKLNDSYFSYAPYSGANWRESVMCQEVGHTFGLSHPSEDPAVDTDSCMDYYQVPNLDPNAHDYEQLGSIYAHLDTSLPSSGGKPGKGNGRRGLQKVSESLWVEDLGGAEKRLVWVTWTHPNANHGPPAGV